MSISNVAGGHLEMPGSIFTPPDIIDLTDIQLGTVSFVPASNQYSHNASIEFKVIDDGVNSADPTSNFITFDVSPINDPPFSQNTTIPLSEDETVTLPTPRWLTHRSKAAFVDTAPAA